MFAKSDVACADPEFFPGEWVLQDNFFGKGNFDMWSTFIFFWWGGVEPRSPSTDPSSAHTMIYKEYEIIL